MSDSRAVILPFICLRTGVLGRLEDSAVSIRVNPWLMTDCFARLWPARKTPSDSWLPVPSSTPTQRIHSEPV